MSAGGLPGDFVAADGSCSLSATCPDDAGSESLFEAEQDVAVRDATWPNESLPAGRKAHLCILHGRGNAEVFARATGLWLEVCA